VGTSGSPTSPAVALRKFVNRGGNFVTYGSNGLTSARNAGMTKLDTSPTDVPPWTSGHCANFATEHGPGALTSPGTSFSASFEIGDPLSWGFDQGGYIYRNSSSAFSNPVFDPSTVHGSGAIPDPIVAASYPKRLVAYGYTCNTLDPGELPGRPYAIDQPFGSGHNALLGSDVFFRGWEAGGAVRLVMNGILFPTGAAIAPSASGKAGGRTTAAHRPVPRRRLPAVRTRPAIHSHDIYRDVRLTVKRSQRAALARIVRRARPPRQARARLRYQRTGARVTLIIPNAYRESEERPLWQWRIIKGLVAHHIAPSERQI